MNFVNRPAIFALSVVLIGLSLAIRDPFFRDTFRYYFQGIGLFILIPALVFGPRFEWVRRILNIPVVDWIGRISYSLYLFHFASLYVGAAVAQAIFPGHGPWTLLAGILVGIPLAFGLASLSYYWIEQPFLKLRAKTMMRTSRNAI